MSYYETALICLNGHSITDRLTSSPDFYGKFCSKCGAETISKCPHCNTNIRGYYRVEGIIDLTGRGAKPPSYCYNCGKPFPWTESRLEAAKELVELTQLDASDKSGFETALKDVTTDSPRTNVGALKVKNLLSKISSSDIRSALIDIIKQVAVKEALKLIG